MEKVKLIEGRVYGPAGNIAGATAVDFAKRLPAFKKWVEKLVGSYGANLSEIFILDVYPFGPADKATRGFVMANVVATKNGSRVSGFALIRGAAVCVLVILQDETGKEYVVTTTQPRVPGGEIDYEEIPAGMMDNDSNFASVATKELEEELHFKIKSSELVKLSDMYPSIGGCDEMITTFVYRGKTTGAVIAEFKGKHTGEPNESEQIVTKLRTYDEFKTACRNGEITDAKAQLTLGLYEMLKAEKGPDAVPAVAIAAPTGGKKTRRRRGRVGKTRKLFV